MEWIIVPIAAVVGGVITGLAYLKGRSDGFIEATVYQRRYSPDSRDADHLLWIAGRLVNVYHEDPNVDFVLKLREIATRLKGV